jgi:hypothetical protein
MEDVAATIEVDEPLPHVEVGNSVGLLKTDTGFHWTIVHIELDLQPAELGSERPIASTCTAKIETVLKSYKCLRE